jgi:hypothetical protein
MHPMKKLISTFSLLLAATVLRAALPQPDLITQIHFAGERKIAADKNAAGFTSQFSSTEALVLRKQTADKLSVWLVGWLAANVGGKVSDGAGRLRPLLDDLQSSEWFLEARTAPDGKVAVALAIKLDASRAQVWQASLKPFFPAATFQTSGGWLVFDSGTASLKLGSAVLGKTASPAADLASLDVNWPLLAKWNSFVKELGLPETRLTLTAADGNCLLNGRLLFPENLNLKLDAWRMPTNTIRQPFNSFTAVRGFAGWLQSRPWAQAYQINPPANQYFVWALPGVPYQTYSAAPYADASAALSQAHARLQPFFNPQDPNPNFLTPFQLFRTNNEISIRGVPFASPYVRAIKEPAGQFLLAGAFPNSPRSKPLPAELFQRLADINLVFYHWEITSERFPNLLNLCQLALALTHHRQLGGEAASMKWVQKIAPTLGHNLTTVTKTGPAEMMFTRKATGPLTAMELFALASWLESANFPQFDVTLPPRPNKGIKRPPAFPLTTPVPTAK